MEGVEMSNANDKYINYYVETLGSTLNDAVLRNISLQANAKISEDVLQELKKEIDFLRHDTQKVESEKLKAYVEREQELIAEINVLKSNHESLVDNFQNNLSEKEQSYVDEINSLKNTIKMHLSAISELQSHNDAMKHSKSEYENTKHQLSHLDTFRNELIKAQKELELYKSSQNEKDKIIDDLKKQIEILQLTPAKKKKASESKLTEMLYTTPVDTAIDALSNIEDGGSF
jgi:chromosome segregation ATPase